MPPLPVMLDAAEAEAVLSATLREVHGPLARLVSWSADPLTKRGKHRVVRYDVHARVAGLADRPRHEWVGKTYERDEDAARVAAVLRELAAVGWHPRGAPVVPRVLGHDATRRLLLLTYEAGESIVKAIGRDARAALAAVGRALAAVHQAPVAPPGGVTTCATVLDDLRPKVAALCDRVPDRAALLRERLAGLERAAPEEADPAAPSFLHGDLGPAQLLWRAGRVVMLDWDRCTRGDPALDLGNLLTQLRRLALRKPGKLPGFAPVRLGLLAAYQRWAPRDPGLERRVAWYEEAILVRKVHALAFDTARQRDAEAELLLHDA